MTLTRIRETVLVAAALLAVAAPAALGQTTPMDWPAALAGQPAVSIQSQAVYYVWHEGGVWHVRWATPIPSLFTGLITTNGAFQNVSGAMTTVVGQRLVFANLGFGGVNGFDFRTTGSTLTFSLALNQGQIAGARVFLGRSGVHPSSMPFTVTMEPALAQIQQQQGNEIKGIDIREQLDRQRNGE